MDFVEIANLLIPDNDLTIEKILEMYPKRNIKQDAIVTRFAPSPTGFLHIGGLFAAFISERFAHQSNGVFYLRIEDTDKKREVIGSISQIINSLNYFNIRFDEGEIILEKEIGNYGPYKQSKRERIYKAFVKALLLKGAAYPCFCSAEDLDSIRDRQKAEKQLTGYYGDWAVCRNMAVNEILQYLCEGTPFVIRLKSPGRLGRNISYKDLVKGEIGFPENVQDIVILKSDGLPTYHFAHAVDDFLMGTTHVFRGDEWLSSIPVHLQLFEVLGCNPPFYGHISPLMKLDGTSKRKFSKRRDPEFAVSWYQEQGYPAASIAEYLLGLANSNFEEWRLKSPLEPYGNFTVVIDKMSGSGALFDTNKLNDVSRNVISTYSSNEVYGELMKWSAKYDIAFRDLIFKYEDYTKKILNIGSGSGKPRKDFTKWADVKPTIFYFYDELFDSSQTLNSQTEVAASANAYEIVQSFLDIYDESDDSTAWFEKIKELCRLLGYARDIKSYKKDPSIYKGHVGDVAAVLRFALTSCTNTPDLYEIMQIMSKERVIRRLERAYSKFQNFKIYLIVY